MTTPLIDAHTHIFPPDIKNNRDRYLGADLWFRRLYQQTHHRLASGDDLILSMDKSGLDASVAFGFAWRDAGLCRAHNDYVLDVAASSEGRIIPFCVTPPADIDFSLQELERCHTLGAIGVGELFPQGQGWNLSDSSAIRLFVDMVRNLNMALLIHTSEPLGHTYAGKDRTTTAPAIWNLIDATEGAVPIILAHWGTAIAIHELMPEIHARTRNVFYDSSTSHLLYNAHIYKVMAGLAPGRILFGSDYPLISQATALRHAKQSNLRSDELAEFLGGTAAKMGLYSTET